MTTPTTTDQGGSQGPAAASPPGRLVRLEEALARLEAPPSSAIAGVDDAIARLCAVAGEALDADAAVYERRAGEEMCVAGRWPARPDAPAAPPETLRAALEAMRRAGSDARAPALAASLDPQGQDPSHRIAALAVRSEGTIAGALVLTGGPALLSGPEDQAALSLVAGMIGREESRRRLAAALLTCEEQLRHVQKVESVGRLASGLAHDVNNWASTIIGHAGVLSVGLSAQDPLQEAIEEIKRAAKHASALTQQVLSFGRRRGAGAAPTDLDLNLVVAGMERMLRPMLPSQLRLATVLPASVGRVRAERGGVEQVLMNLVLNARDAMQGLPGGRITVETFEDEVTAARAQALSLPRAGRYVACAVRDEGAGMDAATRARAFEPFFTTKEAGKGTGLGLSTAWSIVRELGGSIDVESTPGAGACFTVRLPRAIDVGPREAREQEGAARLRGRGEAVLLVEDDEGVRAVTRRILSGAGYRLLEARDGEEAVLLAQRHLGPIDLLLVDAVLPGISGRAVADRILHARRETRVLYMSGYPDHVARERDIIDPGKGFIAKPFAPSLLLVKVREALEARALEDSV